MGNFEPTNSHIVCTRYYNQGRNTAEISRITGIRESDVDRLLHENRLKRAMGLDTESSPETSAEYVKHDDVLALLNSVNAMTAREMRIALKCESYALQRSLKVLEQRGSIERFGKSNPILWRAV